MLRVRQKSVWWLALSLASLVAILSADDAPPAKPALPAAVAKTYHKAAIIHFEGPITPWLEGYFNRKLAAAKKAGADLIVVAVDSPGGYVDERRDLAEM